MNTATYQLIDTLLSYIIHLSCWNTELLKCSVRENKIKLLHASLNGLHSFGLSKHTVCMTWIVCWSSSLIAIKVHSTQWRYLIQKEKLSIWLLLWYLRGTSLFSDGFVGFSNSDVDSIELCSILATSQLLHALKKTDQFLERLNKVNS